MLWSHGDSFVRHEILSFRKYLHDHKMKFTEAIAQKLGYEIWPSGRTLAPVAHLSEVNWARVATYWNDL
jgi:hypothetical protein